ncbi:MAG: PAS domain S-box protein [Telluria sp.]
MRHKLVARQLRRCLGVVGERDLQDRLEALRHRGDVALADGIAAFLDATADAYAQFEHDLQVRTRMLEISSVAAEAAHTRILDSLREVVFQTDPEGNWVYLNPAWAHITGFPVEESLGQRAMWFVHRDDGQAFFGRILALIGREQHYFREQMRFKHRDGSYRWLEVFARRIADDHGANAGLSGSLIDITEQKQVQDRLVVSEQRLHQALRATDSLLWDWDLAQGRPYVDPHWFASLGFPEVDLADIDWARHVHRTDIKRWRDHVVEHLKGERPEIDIEIRYAMASGTWRHTLVRGRAVAWEGRRVTRLAGTLQDISPRREAEAAAQRQQEMTEQILDQLPLPVFLKDRDGHFLRFNRAFERYSGTTRDVMLGKRIEDFASERWAAESRQEDAEAWTSGRMVTSERRLKRLNPPVDMHVSRIVITSGAESYLLGFAIDVSEQRAAREAMQRAVEAAEASSRAKSEFLANMSHEIRTPMNGILGMTELLLQSDLTAEQRDDLALVRSSAHALLTIVNDILDFEKIEAGKLDLEDVAFDLGRLVTDTARTMELRAQQKQLALECTLAPQVPLTVKGDPGRLRQVLLNLLGNAIKFTAAGRVALAVQAGPEEEGRCPVTFTVSDTGIGIPPEKQAMIFEPFAQVDGSTTREYGGTGLGLTICRRLVILMNGEIEVRSEPGVGSAFSFTVPLRPTGVAAPAAMPAAWQAALPPMVALASPVPSGEGDGLRILLAEDNPVNQRLAVRLLQKMGHRVTLVDNGFSALDAALHGGFDLILMDVQMPGMDGLTVTRQLRQHEAPRGAHVPVVAMTARAMQGDRERCLEAGMDDYLAKPVDAARLRQALARFAPAPACALPDWRDALQRLDGDAALFLELAGLFLADGPGMLAELNEALARGDRAASERAAHSLKGVLANFGAREAVERTEMLMRALGDGAQRNAWLAHAEALAGLLEAVYAELEVMAAGGPAALA